MDNTNKSEPYIELETFKKSKIRSLRGKVGVSILTSFLIVLGGLFIAFGIPFLVGILSNVPEIAWFILALLFVIVSFAFIIYHQK